MPEGDTLHRAAARLQPLVGERLGRRDAAPTRTRRRRSPSGSTAAGLEAVEAIGKNLVLRFEGGVVLRSHLRLSGRWTVRPRGAAERGLPWLVLRGAELEGVLFGGPGARAAHPRPRPARPRHPRLAARARGDARHGSIGPTGRGPSARPCSTRASSPGSATGGWQRRSGRRASRPGVVSPRSPAASAGAPSRRPPADAGGSRARPRTAGPGLRPRGSAVPTLPDADPLPRSRRGEPHRLLVPGLPARRAAAASRSGWLGVGDRRPAS